MTATPHKSNGSSVVMSHRHAYPYHMNDGKHLIYVQHECGNHSVLVWSLNHSIMAWFLLYRNLDPQVVSRLYKTYADECDSSSVMIDPNSYLHHIKDGKHSINVWHVCGNHFVLVWSLNHHITTWFLSQKHRIKADFPFHNLRLRKIMWRWQYDLDQHAYPHHMNNCKHLIYVWYGCGNYSVLIWSLNPITAWFLSKLDPGCDFPKSRLTNVTVAVWWWIHMPIHIIWMMANTS